MRQEKKRSTRGERMFYEVKMEILEKKMRGITAPVIWDLDWPRNGK
jgi:hypothetical protein